MDKLRITPTTKSPKIEFLPTGKLYIGGRSFLENTRDFYEPVLEWLSEYVKDPAEETVVDFDLEYFNTSSQLWIFRIVEILLDLVNLNKKIKFIWQYNEEEIKEVGMDLANLLGVEMEFIEKNE